MKRNRMIVIALCLLIFIVGCGVACGVGCNEAGMQSEEVVGYRAEEPEFLTGNQSYAYVRLQQGEMRLLLVTDGTYGYDGLEAGFHSNVYGLDEDGRWLELGMVAGGGTAYPIRVDEKGIYAAGGHFITYYGVDGDVMKLVEMESAGEEFDGEGNVTYTHTSAGGPVQLVADGSYLNALFEKYEQAEIVNFQRKTQ